MELKLSKDKSKLFRPAEKVDLENFPYDIAELSEAMISFIKKSGGIGVAYNQLDLEGNYQMFAMLGEPESYIILNPKIVTFSDELIELDEACLSFPGLVVPQKRARHVRARFMAPDGQIYTKTFANMAARCFQHEFCHINGIPFWEGVSKLKFDRSIKKAYKKGLDYRNLTFKCKNFIPTSKE